MSPGLNLVTWSPTARTSPIAELPGYIFPPRASVMFTVSAVAAWSMLCSADAATMRTCTSVGPTSRSSRVSRPMTFDTSMSAGLPPTRSRSAATASLVIEYARTVRPMGAARYRSARGGSQPMTAPMFTEIDHVAIAVNDLEAAIKYYGDVFGATVDHREVVDSDGVEEALLKVADSYVQLLTPTRDDSPVAKYLASKGEGLHHIGYRVDDCGAALD